MKNFPTTKSVKVQSPLVRRYSAVVEERPRKRGGKSLFFFLMKTRYLCSLTSLLPPPTTNIRTQIYIYIYLYACGYRYFCIYLLRSSFAFVYLICICMCISLTGYTYTSYISKYIVSLNFTVFNNFVNLCFFLLFFSSHWQ